MNASASGGTILVVDDNMLNRLLLSTNLREAGYTVETAEDGEQALALLAARPFDVVLLDLIMPKLDGYQVLERMKRDSAMRHVPVIVISASDEMESVVRCIEMGATDHLPKPFDPVLLHARINASLATKRMHDREVLYLQQIEAERRRADELLHVILPHEVVGELMATNQVKPRRYENVAVLFCDIVGFTTYCDQRDPQEVLPVLQQLFETYEDIAVRYEMQKIKTIGDAFMAAAGLLKPVANPVLNSVRCGQDMIDSVRSLPTGWDVRVGIHVGPVVAGVVGRRQYLFDLWGDTVNTAERMESLSTPGSITLSAAAWQHVAPACQGQSLGMVPVKGKGELELFQFQGFLRD